MKISNIAGCKSINEYISYKLGLFSESDKSMESLFELMFSEKENVFAEITDGYKISKTTYNECREMIEDRTKKLSFILKDVPENSVVGLDLPNSIEWIVIFWGLLKAGFRPLLVNNRVGADVLNDLFKKLSVQAVITESDAYKIKSISPSEVQNSESLSQEQNSFADEVLFMSSNTSGNLKVCGYTGKEFYYQICDSGDIINKCKQMQKHYNGELKLLTFLPFYHIFGLIAVYIWFTFFSRTLVFLKDNDPKNIVNTIKKHQITHVFSVPLFWETIYKTSKNVIYSRGEKTYNKFLRGLKIYRFLSKSYLLSYLFSKIAFGEIRETLFGDSIKFLITGGGSVSKDVLLFFNAIGYHLANGYGATEIGITSVELSKNPAILISGSVGRPFKSTEYKINDNGELLVTGNAKAHSVYIDGERKDQDEWFNTHDIATIKHGHYYVNGRIDDLIICSHGENINPNLIEPKLRIDGIKNLCLIAVTDNENTYSTLLAEVGKYADSAKLSDLQAKLKNVIQRENIGYAVQRIVFTSTPLLSDNEFKLNRKRIAGSFSQGKFNILEIKNEQTNENLDDELVKKVTDIFAEALNIEAKEILRNAHFFFDLGGTSLEYFTMISGVQSAFDVPFPQIDQNSLTTVEQICIYISKNA